TPNPSSSADASVFDTTRSVGTVFTAVPFHRVSLTGHPRPTTRQDSGGGPPPQLPQRSGHARAAAAIPVGAASPGIGHRRRLSPRPVRSDVGYRVRGLLMAVRLGK